jgi:hypothetical protein
VKEDEMGGALSTDGENRNAYTILVRDPAERDHPHIDGSIDKNGFKINRMGKYELDLYGSDNGQVAHSSDQWK